MFVIDVLVDGSWMRLLNPASACAIAYDDYQDAEDSAVLRYGASALESGVVRVIDAHAELCAKCRNENYDPEGFYGPDDLSDDAWVLSSAGMGTDEDYGYYGGDE